MNPPICYSRTITSTQGIRNCFLSTRLLNHSNPLLLLGVVACPPPIRRLTPSKAALASEPPVPLIADKAKLAVSSIASLTVALPLTKEDSVSEAVVVDAGHRGSNQFARKSKREKTRTKSRIEQYTQGLCSA